MTVEGDADRSSATIPDGLLRARRNERYPSRKLRRVDRPTTIVTSEIARVSERDSGFNRAAHGDLGRVPEREVGRFIEKHPLSAALSDMEDLLRLDGPVATQVAGLPDDPVILSRHVKEVCNFLRADAVGVCVLPPYAVYSHDRGGDPVVNEHKNAIAIVVDQGYDSFVGATGHDWISGSQSFVAYTRSAFIARILADYIRRLGYPARAHQSGDYQVVVPPILLLAGIGEMCRIGDIVLNPFLGPRFKASVVTTDMPLAPDKPIDFGLQDFCARCKKCARECPSGAISAGEKVMHNGYERWDCDSDACTRYRVTNARGSSCGRCIKVCPWNKPDSWYHGAATRLARRSGLARRGLIWLDDAMGYQNADPSRKWWFDLEEIDGRLLPR